MVNRCGDSRVLHSLRLATAMVAALVLLSGCAGFRLYDASKAATATAAKEKLSEAKVTETVDVSLKNSQEFLKEAERIAALEASVRKERALLDIAESGRSMASWLERRWQEQAELGFPNTAVAHENLQSDMRVERALGTAEKNRQRMKTYAGDPAVAALLVGLACDGIEATSEPPETTKLDLFDIASFHADFAAYKTACLKMAEAKRDTSAVGASELSIAETNRERMRSYAGDPVVAALLDGPVCDEITEASEPPATTKLDTFDAELFNEDYAAYKSACVELAAVRREIPEGGNATGAIQRAKNARAAAQTERKALLDQVAAAKEKLAAASKELQQVAKADRPDLKELRKKAEKVREAAVEVAALSEKIGIESAPLEKIEDLAVILAAVSSGEVNKDAVAGKEMLTKASLAAAELPSLAEDAIGLLAAGDAPPTNHLILALNHQQILYSRAVELSDLWQEELDLHDRKIAALREQARQYREIQYRLCNYATEKAGKKHQGEACAVLSFEDDGAHCIIGTGASQLDIADCQLAKSWRASYSGSNTPRAKRQLLAALLAYSRAQDARAEVRKIDFQMINVGHKRVIASTRAAIAAWNNLVDVPVSTLDAYYAAGVKPDTIATALAQLLGLLGVGVGIGVSN